MPVLITTQSSVQRLKHLESFLQLLQGKVNRGNQLLVTITITRQELAVSLLHDGVRTHVPFSEGNEKWLKNMADRHDAKILGAMLTYLSITDPISIRKDVDRSTMTWSIP